jgi:hypothetical protein
MREAGWTRAAIAFGLLAAGGIATAITGPSHAGGVIAAVVFGAIAARCWYMGG